VVRRRPRQSVRSSVSFSKPPPRFPTSFEAGSNPTAYSRRLSHSQFPICPIEIRAGNRVSSSLIAHYSSLTYLPYPISTAILEAIRRVARKAVRKIAPQAIRRGIWRATRTAIRSIAGQAIWRGTRRATRKAAGTAAVQVALQIARTIALEVVRRTICRVAGRTIRRAIPQIPR